jgi:hypothetical protein
LKIGGNPELIDSNIKWISDIKSLEVLDLSYNPQITDEALIYLKDLNNLKKLILQLTGITNAGLKHLNTLKNLEYLDVALTRVDESGKNELQQQLPKCGIRFTRPGQGHDTPYTGRAGAQKSPPMTPNGVIEE